MNHLVLDHAVPLVGQRVMALGCTLIGMIQCQCDAHCVMQVTWQSGAMGQARVGAVCPACHYTFAIQSIGLDHYGQLLFNLDITAPHLEEIPESTTALDS